ncbi:MAG: sigma-70 family RNA polymerase sigma factor, partial [Planctomycetota bacterium]|nr:sigma-70 family RNA polymerase sigma factor [Planctomycetota bacterium]
MKPGEGSEEALPDGDAEDAARLRRFVQTNDREALNALLRRHLDVAYRVARRMSRNAADAEDAVQSACVYLLRNAKRYRGDGSVRAWFVSMVVSACRSKHREAGRRERRERIAERAQAVETTGAGVKQAETREDRTRMFAALERLPEHYRLPVWLHYIEGLTSVEVGKALGISENTVRSQIRRGLDELRGALGLSGARAAGLPEALAALPLDA